MRKSDDFNAVRISIASPEQIQYWSRGEVTRPETINYRTLKPAKDGLFCEKIFGPTKDFECYCGKYKRMQHKGVICDRCGVEVTRSEVRRQRMGHITLATPVAHIWYAKGSPSQIGLLLGLSARNLERVLYFVQYIVTSVDETLRQEKLQEIQELTRGSIEQQELFVRGKIEELRKPTEFPGDAWAEEDDEAIDEAKNEAPDHHLKEISVPSEAIDYLEYKLTEEKLQKEEESRASITELESLRPMMLLSESAYQELTGKYGDVFEAEMGAEAILKLLKNCDLEQLRHELWEEVNSSSGQRHKKAMKRLEVVEAFLQSGNKPEWMILTVLPVLPPDLRPMVQLDGGRFATADLNDLYRRVLNRNNRLLRLAELGAPQVILRNEKRMLQEAVDALVDNTKRGKVTSNIGNRSLKSLSDMLRGKHGRFRQNLLGKRVDYSGRSVIIVGPELKFHQCGLPKRMALELFKPFVMSKLVQRGIASNIKSAKRMVDRAKPEIWDILEEVIQSRPVLLNRAPTLHRLGIQAFEPTIIEGSAIRIHPLVCTAFNADFDGDQMAVHVPLSKLAVQEARESMLITQNMLSTSNGEPVVAPTLDIVLGCYYLTSIRPSAKGEGLIFGNFEEALLAFELGVIDTRAEIEVRVAEGEPRIKTSAGRIIFNQALPEGFGFRNESMGKSSLKKVIAQCIRTFGNEASADVLDKVKNLGFQYATRSGTTISAADIQIPSTKTEIVKKAEELVEQIEQQYNKGFVDDEERYKSIVQTWTDATDDVTNAIAESLDRYGGVYMMTTSGAKGNIAQLRQMAGMRGLMTDPTGKIIDFPIKSSFREGLSVIEYFISTHGARKGLADTALRTSDSGYLTRRLVDVAQDVLITEEDCGTTRSIRLTETGNDGLLPPLAERILGRYAAVKVVNPLNNDIIVNRNEEIDEDKAEEIATAGIEEVYVRSPLSCQSHQGLCQLCYGRDLGRGRLVSINTAVGVIAAQSIGEPGTQLTLRTFHTGGVVGQDITVGLPRVEELFEARSPKGQAIVAEIDGNVELMEVNEGRRIKITSAETYRDTYTVSPDAELLVDNDQWVDVGTPLVRQSATGDDDTLTPTFPLLAQMTGRVSINEGQIVIAYEGKEEREYLVPTTASLLVENGSRVYAGQQLMVGHVNPQDILRIKGREAVQRYLVEEVQTVYRSQGVNTNDKHIEVIVTQMLRRVCVDYPGDSNLLPGTLVDHFEYEDVNAKVLAEGGEPATAQTVLLGITKASLKSDSFLAAASFQETTRILAEAALHGKLDVLKGLKENVVIGRLIPFRCCTPAEVEKEPVAVKDLLSEQMGDLPKLWFEMTPS